MTGMSQQDDIIYCHCANASIIPPLTKRAVLQRLCTSNVDFLAVVDLCRWAIADGMDVDNVSQCRSARIAACHPRAVRWLLDEGGLPQSKAGHAGLIANMRESDTETVLAKLFAHNEDESSSCSSGRVSASVILYEGDGCVEMTAKDKFAIVSALLAEGCDVLCCRNLTGRINTNRKTIILGKYARDVPPASDAVVYRDITRLDALGVVAVVRRMELAPHRKWRPWFPVIDYERCISCKQCLSFCLFNVYGLDDEGTVRVRNPQNCKNNCPACSRVCPKLAIIFPKYDQAPINGSDVLAEHLSAEPVQVDMTALMKKGVHSALRERTGSKKRFAPGNTTDRSTEQLQKQLGIPQEVIAQIMAAQGESTDDSVDGSDNDALNKKMIAPSTDWDV